ncbi:ATP-dependent zinc metalloprotease FtsH [Myxococcota bacterium]|nr:ATP-dependent zinc metalloprotease FtsH [Myxococcota bacterium]
MTANAFATVIFSHFCPTRQQARLASDTNRHRRAARIYKWLHKDNRLDSDDIQEFLKALAYTGDPQTYWADVATLPPKYFGATDVDSITSLSLSIRSALDTYSINRENSEIQRENLALTRELTELNRQLLECSIKALEQQERQFGHLDCHTQTSSRGDKDASPGVTLDDVRGIDEVKREVAIIVDFLRAPEQFTRLGGRIPKGILIMGPPGTGKTLLARAIAGEANAQFHAISASDFVEMYVGVGASRVRRLFELAKQKTPSIVFIDELDAVGRHRSTADGAFVHEEREQTLNQLLVEMDGFEPNQGIILIAATNRPDILDKALLRPGRFDRHIVVPRPDSKGRQEILEHHARRRNVPLAEDVDLAALTRVVPGWSGADLENLINEAALMAAVAASPVVKAEHLRAARDKIAMGLERRSLVLGEKERRIAAYHEAGHALAAHLLPSADPVDKVSIIPRGQALGVTLQIPDEDCHHMTKAAANDAIAVALAGRVAEELVLEQQSSGAGQDLELATEVARRMVCEWGMSERLGPLSFRVGGAMSRYQDLLDAAGCSPTTADEIDSEIRKTVLNNYHRATNLLKEHRAHLDALAAALLDRETLEHDDVVLIVNTTGPATPAVSAVPAATTAATASVAVVPVVSLSSVQSPTNS